jgi:Flp pilus assembly protein TadB
MGYSMQTSFARLAHSNYRAGLSWAAVALLFVITVFGVVVIGHIPKWPIYVTIMVWWAFVVYTTIHINHEKEAPIAGS